MLCLLQSQSCSNILLPGAVLFEGGQWSSILRWTTREWTALLYQSAGVYGFAKFVQQLIIRRLGECLMQCSACISPLHIEAFVVHRSRQWKCRFSQGLQHQLPAMSQALACMQCSSAYGSFLPLPVRCISCMAAFYFLRSHSLVDGAICDICDLLQGHGSFLGRQSTALWSQ